MAWRLTPHTASSGSRYAALLLLPALRLAKNTGGAGAMAAYLALWGLFTVILFIGSLKMSRALQFVLGTLALVFFLESAGAASGIISIHYNCGVYWHNQRARCDLHCSRTDPQ